MKTAEPLPEPVAQRIATVEADLTQYVRAQIGDDTVTVSIVLTPLRRAGR